MFHQDAGLATGGGMIGDWGGIPINEAGRMYALAWDASRMTIRQQQCPGYAIPYFYFPPRASASGKSGTPIPRSSSRSRCTRRRPSRRGPSGWTAAPIPPRTRRTPGRDSQPARGRDTSWRCAHAHPFGPQLTALIAYLAVVCRMPRLVVQRFLEGVLQIPISLGSTQNAWEETSAAVAAPYAELQAALPHESVVNADETGHRTNGDKRWLWTFVARTFVLHRIAASRGSDVLQRALGETFAGILGSDRLPAYLKYGAGHRQLCWAHMTRHLLSALDLATTPAAKRFCREAVALDRRLFRLWHRFRGDPGARGAPLTRTDLIAKVLPIEKRLFALGERHLHAANADVRNLAHAFFVHNQHFFAFVYEEGVAPTNNADERALRTAVQWRKIMFGTSTGAFRRTPFSSSRRHRCRSHF